LLATSVLGQQNKTVIGPNNVALSDGAAALRAGEAKEGVRLTLLGLSQALGPRERKTAKSNLCAGYTLLQNYTTALEYCDEVLLDDDRYWAAYSNRALIYIKLRRFEEADQDHIKGEALRPNGKTLKAVRKMYLDAVHPVAPIVIIDDRQDVEGELDDAD
jgi:tetratricopeptide (TPR) repeat protein